MPKIAATKSKRISSYYRKIKERSPPKARSERSPLRVLKDVTNTLEKQGQVQGASKENLNWKSKIIESTSFSSSEDATSDYSNEPTVVSSRTPSTSHSSTDGGSEDTLQAVNKTEKEADAHHNCSSSGKLTSKGTSQSTPLWNRDDFKGPRKLDVSTDTDHTTEFKQDIVLVNIETRDLDINEIIGEGSFGKVYKGLWKGGIEVAVKETPKRNCEPNFNELDICRRLRHPNVIQLIGYAITDTTVLMVMNCVKGRNLGVALGLEKPTTNDSAKILDEKCNGHVLYTAAQGLAYIHQKGIIHQDFKPTNIMIEDVTNKAVICDLGVAVQKKDQISSGTIVRPNAGTTAYQHREQILGHTPTPSVDVYSFGVVTLVVFTRMPAWGGFSSSEIKNKIMNGEYPVIQKNKVPEKAQELISECFQPWNKRPSITGLFPLLRSMTGVIDTE